MVPLRFRGDGAGASSSPQSCTVIDGCSPSASFDGENANTVGVCGGKRDEAGEATDCGEADRAFGGWVSIWSPKICWRTFSCLLFVSSAAPLPSCFPVVVVVVAEDAPDGFA